MDICICNDECTPKITENLTIINVNATYGSKSFQWLTGGFL